MLLLFLGAGMWWYFPSKIQSLSPQSEEISVSELQPFLNAVGEVRCVTIGPYGISSIGSGSLWDFGGDPPFAVLTNEHVIATRDCLLYTDPEPLPGETPDSFARTTFRSIHTLELVRVGSDLSQVDAAVMRIIPKDYDTIPVSKLNFAFSPSLACPSLMPLGSNVTVIGFPSFSHFYGEFDTVTSKTITKGSISAYQRDPLKDQVDYFISAEIDAGSSGGIALARSEKGVCVLGIPTWIFFGEYASQGVVQNIHNVLNKWRNVDLATYQFSIPDQFSTHEDEFILLDSYRISDILQIQIGLELYFDSNGFYPAQLSELEGEFIPFLPRDPQTDSLYLYGFSADRQNSVVGAVLEDPNSPAFTTDSDGTVYGVDCDDPTYCRSI